VRFLVGSTGWDEGGGWRGGGRSILGTPVKLVMGCKAVQSHTNHLVMRVGGFSPRLPVDSSSTEMQAATPGHPKVGRCMNIIMHHMCSSSPVARPLQEVQLCRSLLL
jgi:hypothetical protein